MDWKNNAKILDDLAWKYYNEVLLPKNVEYGFRELFPVIETEEQYNKTIEHVFNTQLMDYINFE